MRIAVLGGTFDPIHNGHLAAAESVASTFHVDEVHFVPSFSPPHKQEREITSPFHRVAMVALATTLPDTFPQFRTSTIEVDTLSKRYTVETLEDMRSLYPSAQLFFVLGTDMYRELETWKNYRKLFDLAHLVIVNRPGFSFRPELSPYRTLYQGEPDFALSEKPGVFYLPFVEQRISATAIREGCRNGEPIQQWLSAPVWSYIQNNKLYS